MVQRLHDVFIRFTVDFCISRLAFFFFFFANLSYVFFSFSLLSGLLDEFNVFWFIETWLRDESRFCDWRLYGMFEEWGSQGYGDT